MLVSVLDVALRVESVASSQAKVFPAWRTEKSSQREVASKENFSKPFFTTRQLQMLP